MIDLRSIAPHCALCMVNAAEAVEVLSAGYILSQVTNDPHIQSAVASAVFLGMLVGGIVSGVASDHLGRVWCLRLATGLAALATVSVAFSPNLSVLLTARWLSGLGVGAATPPLFAIVPDMTPSRWTGLAVVSIACFWMVGSLYTATAALAILHDVPTASDWQPDWGAEAPWRRFALACAVMPLAATVLVTCWVHEPDAATAPITSLDSRARVSSSSSLLHDGPAGGIAAIVAASRSSLGRAAWSKCPLARGSRGRQPLSQCGRPLLQRPTRQPGPPSGPARSASTMASTPLARVPKSGCGGALVPTLHALSCPVMP